MTTSSHPPPSITAALAAISHDYPRWSTWRGIGGLLYAHRRSSSPALVVRAVTPDQLRVLIELAIRERNDH